MEDIEVSDLIISTENGDSFNIERLVEILNDIIAIQRVLAKKYIAG